MPEKVRLAASLAVLSMLTVPSNEPMTWVPTTWLQPVPVYLHCRSSQRSYYAYSILRGRGWDNVYNISGSFLGISLYEYFNDKTTGREPIVTDYNFD